MREGRAPELAIALALALVCAAWPARPREDRPSVAPPRTGAARLLWGLPLDLNREDERTLQVLPGIGPNRATAIRSARPFCTVSDLRRVRGLGPVTLGRLAGLVAVSPASGCSEAGIEQSR